MLFLSGSNMSVTWGPCSVLALLRDSGLFGAASRREKDREGCKFLGRSVMLAIYVEWSGPARVVCQHRTCGAAETKSRARALHHFATSCGDAAGPADAYDEDGRPWVTWRGCLKPHMRKLRSGRREVQRADWPVRTRNERSVCALELRYRCGDGEHGPAICC